MDKLKKLRRERDRLNLKWFRQTATTREILKCRHLELEISAAERKANS